MAKPQRKSVFLGERGEKALPGHTDVVRGFGLVQDPEGSHYKGQIEMRQARNEIY